MTHAQLCMHNLIMKQTALCLARSESWFPCRSAPVACPVRNFASWRQLPHEFVLT